MVTDRTGTIRIYKERIFRSTVRPRSVFKDGNYGYGFLCTVSYGSAHHVFDPVRMVYFLFKEEYPLENPHYLISTINGNDLDIRPENLELTYVRNYRLNYRRSNDGNVLDKKIRLFRRATFSQDVIYRKSLVSCYSQSGIRITTFENLQKAQLLTQISQEEILDAMIHPSTLLNNLYWRSGKCEMIDTSIIRAYLERSERIKAGIQLTQFDLNGNPIDVYYSVADAAKANDITASEILDCLNGLKDVAGCFLWKPGFCDKPIPGL